MYHWKIILLLSVLFLSPAYSETLDELKKKENTAVEKSAAAAEAAKKAARDAAKAAQQAIEASKQAEQFAGKAEEASYQAYLAQMARWRMERMQTLEKPSIPDAPSEEISNPIDRFVMAKWDEEDAPEVCSDYTFIRRVYLDITGIIPAATEVEAFIEDDSKTKRAKLIDTVLAQDEDYAAHWVQFWEDALASNGKHQGGVGTRANFRKYIYESFKENKPYDVFTAQLIDPTAVKYRGGFVKSETHQDSLLTAANIGQVFLGTKMKCASCHDDFLNFNWTQKRFFQFASFFSEENLEIIRCEEPQGVYVKPAYIFNSGEANPDNLDSLKGRLSEVTRFLVDPANPRFARAFVNRLWKRYIGLGLVEPVDNFRQDIPPSHPELLDWMAYEFAANGYDIKHMIRLIMNSNTYQLQYDEELADRYEDGSDYPRAFRSPQLRKLTAEQYLDSLNLALGELDKRISFDETTTALTLALGRPATRNEIQTLRSDDVAVLQALELINGPDLYEMVYEADIQEHLAGIEDAEKAVETVFMSMYSRPPSEDELKFTLKFFGPDIDEKEWSDILWSLAVSPEFQYIR